MKVENKQVQCMNLYNLENNRLDFRFAPRCLWDVRSFGTVRSVKAPKCANFNNGLSKSGSNVDCSLHAVCAEIVWKYRANMCRDSVDVQS